MAPAAPISTGSGTIRRGLIGRIGEGSRCLIRTNELNSDRIRRLSRVAKFKPQLLA